MTLKADQSKQTEELPDQGDLTISFVIPCYNSADYMDACISSMLGAGSDSEIIIVDDGSTDATGAKADRWVEMFPDKIRVIHQENAGHGGAVMAGVRAARGSYLKVVDSDDWLDRVGLNLLMSKLRSFLKLGQQVDMVVCNYVYEHVLTGSKKVIGYRNALPLNRIITWDDTRRFSVGQNILMHSVVYRTQVLRDSKLDMPKHTFYVDNIFVYQPLPYVKTLYYLPVDLYHYFIGREDQSVNEEIMLGRLDQQIRVTRIMTSAYSPKEDVPNKKLANYMEDYLALIVAASSIFALLRDDEEAYRLRKEMWESIRESSPALERRLRKHFLVAATNSKLPGARQFAISGYRIAQRIYHFN